LLLNHYLQSSPFFNLHYCIYLADIATTMFIISNAITPNPFDLPLGDQPTNCSSNPQPTENTPGYHSDLHPINLTYRLYGKNYLQWPQVVSTYLKGHGKLSHLTSKALALPIQVLGHGMKKMP